MRKPEGYVTVVGDIGPGEITVVDSATGLRHVEQEIDTFQCGHCQRTVHVPPRADPASVGGGCFVCQRNICPACVDRGICVPWEEMLARMEARRSYEEASRR